MKKMQPKNWFILGLIFLVIGIFVPIFIYGLIICWFIMSVIYYKNKKQGDRNEK